MPHASTTSGPDAEDIQKIMNRLKRLEGQVRGLQNMISSDKNCDEVLTQVMAVKSAINQVGLHVIGHAMKRCLLDDENRKPDELVDDAIAMFLKYSACMK
ncbi:MAG: metal-sensitive transcriptional regulator [Actinobacteria bacterium]|nr:metal-sensitive transcriptional regulator [Actinomycetota bacterium]MCL5888212.1 metal-sensitive transcriptional regulator [Actinomycetota bacterium]